KLAGRSLPRTAESPKREVPRTTLPAAPGPPALTATAIPVQPPLYPEPEQPSFTPAPPRPPQPKRPAFAGMPRPQFMRPASAVTEPRPTVLPYGAQDFKTIYGITLKR